MPEKTDFHALLRSTFGDDDIVAQRLRSLEEAEEEGEAILLRYPGFKTVIDRVFLFLLDTVGIAEADRRRRGKNQPEWYGSLLLDFTTHVKRLRAAYRLLESGYPLFATALLRDVRERALLYAAILNGTTTIREVLGLPETPPAGQPVPPLDVSAVVKARTSNQRAALKTVDGKNSGLDPETISQLAYLKTVLDSEVHGSMMTATECAAFITGGHLAVLPRPTPDMVLTCISVTLTAAHHLVRTLPVLQLEPAAFGPVWLERWRVMDSALAWALQTTKPISAATAELTERKLAFDPATHAYRGG